MTETLGAGLVRPGTTPSPEQDLLFASGWPHVGFAEPTSDADPHVIAAEHLERELAQPNGWCLPLAAASLLARAKTQATRTQDDLKQWTADPLAAGEVAAMVRECFTRGSTHRPLGRPSLLLFEAIAGPDEVAPVLVDALDSLGPDELARDDNARGLLVWELGFVLLRLAPADADDLRARLEVVFERARAAFKTDFESRGTSPSSNLARRLDVILHGREGALRSGYRPDRGDSPLDCSALVHVCDDASFVAEQITQATIDEYTPVWPRAVYLGGDRAIEHVCAHWREYGEEEHATLTEQLTELAHPAIDAMLSEMG